MKENILILMVIALLFVGFFSTGISYTGEAYRGTIVSGSGFQGISTTGDRNYLIYTGNRAIRYTSPGGVGLSFLTSNLPKDKGDLDDDGDRDKNDFRILLAMYGRSKDIRHLTGKEDEEFNLGRQYQGGTLLGYTKSSIGYFDSRGDLDNNGIINSEDVARMHMIVNPFLGIKTSTIEDWVRAVNCAEPGRKTCAVYSADDKIYKRDRRISQNYIGTCIELVPGGKVARLYAYDYEACPVGTECVNTYGVVIDEFRNREEVRGAECRARVPRQQPNR
ncbi:MAG: hypothetical protein AABY07_01950 [Nanoarchaeota archaeon]